MSEEALLVSRIQELRDAESLVLRNTNKAELEFQVSLARFRKEWADEQEKHLAWKKETETDIRSLEEKRRVLLVPVSELESKAKKKNEEADERLKELKKKELDIEETKGMLEDRLDDVGAREQDVERKEKELKSKEEGIALSAQELLGERETFNKTVADFESSSKQRNLELSEKAKDIFLRERSVESREQALFGRENDLRKKERQLEDQRHTLEREIARRK